MPMDYEDKPPGDYDPTKIEKKPGQLQTRGRNAGSSTGPIAGAVKKIPPVKRFIINQDRRTVEAEASRVKAENRLIDAHSEQEEALQRNARERIESARYSPANAEQEIRKNYVLDDLDRQDAIEEREQQLAIRRKQRARELAEYDEKPAAPKPQQSRADRLEQMTDDILRYGTTGLASKIARRKIEELIAERGGREHLTKDDEERIRLALAEALREDESKSE